MEEQNTLSAADPELLQFQRQITQALQENQNVQRPSTRIRQPSFIQTYGKLEDEEQKLNQVQSDQNGNGINQSISIDLSLEEQKRIKPNISDVAMAQNFSAQRRNTLKSQTLEIQYKDRLRSLKPYKYCIILPDDPWKLRWDLFISILIIWTCIGSPLSLAFTQNDQNLAWIIVDSLTDFCFLIDIIFTFRSAYFNAVERLVDSLKQIQCHYLKFWFWVDMIAILPIGIILNRASNPNSLIRIARITRLYRMVKMVKLLRMMRLMKNRRQYARFVRSVLRISIGVERLFIFAILAILLCHMSSCIWYFLAQNGSELYSDSWVIRYGFQNTSLSKIYLVGVYFTITTITTVGYGDISAGNTQERVYCLILMIIGVVAYSFAIGSLTGIISSMDSKTSKIRQKIDILTNIRSEYNIDFGLYWRLRRSLYYQQVNQLEEKEKFLSELPTSLRVDLSHAIYKQVVANIDFFQGKSGFFIAAVVPKLKKLKFNKNECFFRKGNPIDGIYFLVQGVATYVEKVDSDDIEFAKHEQGSYFGHLDFFRSPDDDDSMVARRSFTVKAQTDCITMFLSKVELFNIGAEYIHLISELFVDSIEDLEKLHAMRESALNWFYKQNPGLSRTRQYSKKAVAKSVKQIEKQHRIASMLMEKAHSYGGIPAGSSSQFMPYSEDRRDKQDSERLGPPSVAGTIDGGVMMKLEEVLREMAMVRKETAEVRKEMAEMRVDIGLGRSIDEGSTHKLL